MSENWSPLVRISARNGVIAGLLGFVLLLGLYFMGKHPFLFPIYFDFRLFLFGIFLVITLREIRDTQENILFFWQGMIACFLFTILFAAISSGLIGIYAWLNPAFLQNYITTAIEQMKSIPEEAIKQIGKDVYESNLKALPATNSLDMSFHYLWQSFIISFFLSIIISVILRRQPPIDSKE